MAMLKGASVMDKTTGGKLLLVDLDATEAITVKTRKNGNIGVFLNLVAKASDNSKVPNSSHFIVPDVKRADGTNPPICGNVIQFPQRQDNQRAPYQNPQYQNAPYQNAPYQNAPYQGAPDPYAQFRTKPAPGNYGPAVENSSADGLPF